MYCNEKSCMFKSPYCGNSCQICDIKHLLQRRVQCCKQRKELKTHVALLCLYLKWPLAVNRRSSISHGSSIPLTDNMSKYVAMETTILKYTNSQPFAIFSTSVWVEGVMFIDEISYVCVWWKQHFFGSMINRRQWVTLGLQLSLLAQQVFFCSSTIDILTKLFFELMFGLSNTFGGYVMIGKHWVSDTWVVSVPFQ